MMMIIVNITKTTADGDDIIMETSTDGRKNDRRWDASIYSPAFYQRAWAIP